MNIAELITKIEMALKSIDTDPQKHYFSPTNSQSKYVLNIGGEQFFLDITKVVKSLT